MTRIQFAALLAICALLSGCAKDIRNKEAVKQGIVDYFKKRNSEMGLNLDAITIDIQAVDYRGKEATATVAIRVKQMATNESAMQMTYVLEQKGDKWEVKGRPSAGTDTHAPGAAPQGELPAGHPPTGASPQIPALPPGHPSTGTPAPVPALPPGHPPVDPNKVPPPQTKN
ncbi:MAG: hypothetical protein ABI823_21845 [Bryobacteraceae bacterium]